VKVVREFAACGIRGVAATLVALAAPHLPCRAEVPVLTVCELLNNRLLYNGQTTIVVGRYFAYMEGVSVESHCATKISVDGKDWNDSIWLEYDRSHGGARPADLWNTADYERTIATRLPGGEAALWKTVPVCNYVPGMWVAVYGRFETKERFPILRSGPAGFGHLGMYIAQVAFSSNGISCRVPAEKYSEYAAIEQKRKRKSDAALWRNIRAALNSSGGLEYFAAHVKDRLLPPMEGKVASVESTGSVLVVMTDGTSPEIRIQIRPLLNRTLLPGTHIEFKGVATACTLHPLLMTVDVADDEVTVLGDGTKVAPH
jgi:hypothetical protein